MVGQWQIGSSASASGPASGLPWLVGPGGKYRGGGEATRRGGLLEREATGMTSRLSLNTGQAEGRAAQERRGERCEHRRRQAQEGRARRPLRSPAPPGDAPPTSTAARALDEARLRSGHARDCTNVLPELLTELLLMGSVCARVAPHEMHGWWSWFWTVLFQRGPFCFQCGWLGDGRHCFGRRCVTSIQPFSKVVTVSKSVITETIDLATTASTEPLMRCVPPPQPHLLLQWRSPSGVRAVVPRH